MYSYGASARAAGKRGHGGRQYRPPPDRSKPKPPSLKECDCLLEFDIDEYRSTGQRVHGIFGGRESLAKLEKDIRGQCLVHLVVPGKNQAGPVGIVGKTINEALQGAHVFLNFIHADTDIPGRLRRNVKDDTSPVLHGLWRKAFSNPHKIFYTNDWSILSFRITDEADAKQLKLSLDNFVFRHGQAALERLEFFQEEDGTVIFCAGPTIKTQLVLDTISSEKENSK